MTRPTLSRAFYVPAGAAKITHKATGSEAYLYMVDGKPCAALFLGKAQKPKWRYRFRSEAERAARIEKDLANFAANRQAAADRRAASRRPHKLEVGHILVASWGYEQTNVDFYQVTRVIGAHTVEIREIEGNVTRGDGGWSGQVIPAIDAFTGEPMIKRVIDGDTVKIESFAYARLWDGLPRNWTAYA